MKRGGTEAPRRPQKITFATMRGMGMRGLLVSCADYHCSHSIASAMVHGHYMAVDLSLIVRETRMLIADYRPHGTQGTLSGRSLPTCTGCGRRGRAWLARWSACGPSIPTCRARPRIRGRFGSPMQSALAE